MPPRLWRVWDRLRSPWLTVWLAQVCSWLEDRPIPETEMDSDNLMKQQTYVYLYSIILYGKGTKRSAIFQSYGDSNTSQSSTYWKVAKQSLTSLGLFSTRSFFGVFQDFKEITWKPCRILCTDLVNPLPNVALVSLEIPFIWHLIMILVLLTNSVGSGKVCSNLRMAAGFPGFRFVSFNHYADRRWSSKIFLSTWCNKNIST